MVVDTAVRIFLVCVRTACPTVQKIILLFILYYWPEDGPRDRNMLLTSVYFPHYCGETLLPLFQSFSWVQHELCFTDGS